MNDKALTRYASIVGIALQIRDQALRGIENCPESFADHMRTQIWLKQLLKHLEETINDD